MSTTCVTLRAAHHHTRSGPDHLARYAASRTLTLALSRWPAGRIPAALNTLCAAVSRAPWYSYAALRLEMTTMGDMSARRGELYHFLHADTDCRYVPFLNGWRDHKVMATYHQPPAQLRQGVPSDTIRKLSAVVAVASNQVGYLSELAPPDRVFTVPLGVDTQYFSPSADPKASPPLILSVGGHLRDCGAFSLAASLVGRREPEARFVVVTRPSYAEQFAGLGNVQVRHHVPDEELLALYRQATMAVLPLSDSTANLALLEAIACALPVIVTDVGGVRDYVDDSCALLAPLGDGTAIAELVLQLLNDSTLRRSLGQRSRARALRFDFRLVAERMKRVYAAVKQL